MASSVRFVFALLLGVSSCAVGSKFNDFECDPALDRTCDSAHQVAAADAGHPHDAATTHNDAATAWDAAAPLDSATTFDASNDTAVTQQCALPIRTGMAVCDTCLGTRCCTEDEACGNSRDCSAYLQCGNDCFSADGGATQACFDACTVQYPAGSALMDALGQCMSTSCTAECGGP